MRLKMGELDGLTVSPLTQCVSFDTMASMLPVRFGLLLALLVLPADHSHKADLAQTLAQVSAAYAKLEPQSIRPAEGFIKYDYLIPAGYYKQMWDWDCFFIGSPLG